MQGYVLVPNRVRYIIPAFRNKEQKDKKDEGLDISVSNLEGYKKNEEKDKTN